MSMRQFHKEPIWTPNENSGKRMKTFIKTIEKKYNLKFTDYWDFHRWTVENIAELFAEIWDFFGVIYSKTYDQVVDLSVPMEECPKWFEGARLNLAENFLKFRDDHTALISAGEDKEVESLTYKQMYGETKLYAAALKKIGFQKGDVAACYISNRIEAVIAMLAVVSIGGIWTGGLPTIGPQAFLNRLKQVEPKILLTIDQFSHNKEIYHLLNNVKEITEELPSLKKVIIIARSKSKLKDISYIKNSCFLEEFLKTAYNSDGTVPELVFEQVSFSHPVFINFTSGSTGLPKTLVHGSGGLLNAARDFGLHWDNRREDNWLSMSPMGWVSWNFLIYMLFLGCTITLFEGVPYFLSPTHIWDMIDNLKITRIFLSPSILDELETRKYLPTEKHHLSSLNMILCGSSVVKPRNYEFVLKLKKGFQFVVGYGCTEIMGFFMACDSTLPLHVGEISNPSLGISPQCLDDEGNLLPDGEMGEIALTNPLPSLPLGFWGDKNGARFKKAYFSKFPGKFVIGDSIIINPVTKGVIVCGRSDETIKQRGCRFGSSEIYNVVKLFPEIRDSLCVGQYNKERDERAVLFLWMEQGHSFNEELNEKLRQRIAKELTPKHVPEVILEAPGIPFNANGKKTEIIVKKIINKMPHNPETVDNSECLQFYYDVSDRIAF